MKRKTNLFNLNNIEDTLFLTFSNYTEYLTGNFLGTNTKMYPSTFLCIKLPFSEDKSIEDFKKYLMGYYENKLALLRTKFIETDVDPENEINPLFYLLDTIDNYFNGEKKAEFVYAGDIVEQDYNGTYTDSICIVNLNSGYNIEVNYQNFTGVQKNNTDNIDILYGWEENQILSLYDTNIQPIYDYNNEDEIGYYTGSKTYSIEFSKRSNSYQNTSIVTSIEFNCIIPLFDIKNTKEDNIQVNDVIKYDDCLRANIPLGIWISPEQIKISKYSGYSQSWSLVIGSKFSPLPYSSINAIDDNNSFDNSTVKDIAYLTYAELLANHAELQTKYNEALEQIYTLSNEVNNLKSQMSSLLFQSNLEKISEMIDDKFVTLQNNFDSKMKLIEEYIANLKWKYIN